MVGCKCKINSLAGFNADRCTELKPIFDPPAAKELIHWKFASRVLKGRFQGKAKKAELKRTSSLTNITHDLRKLANQVRPTEKYSIIQIIFALQIYKPQLREAKVQKVQSQYYALGLFVFILYSVSFLCVGYFQLYTVL